MFQFTQLPPLSLYIHVPWCERKCPYCDFNSHQPSTAIPERAYIDALLRDLGEDLPRVWGRSVQTVFIGGGTPSLLSAEAIDRLLSGLRALLALRPDAEITLEANPGSAEQARFAEYRSAGINRLSIGVQSFSDDSLQRLGRIHDRRAAIAGAEMAHAAGFDNFNLDLMFALPEQTATQALEDVATAIALEPTHISYYQLTLEPNTRFFARPPSLPDDDQAWHIQQQGQAQLAEAGYGQYEVSAYAREGRRCAHNVNYWQFGDYLGIGAGAHAKLSDGAQQNITRVAKRRGPQDYLDAMTDASTLAQRIQSERIVRRDEVGLEFMMNALRLREGFAPSLFTAHTGQPLLLVEPSLRTAEEQGLLHWSLDNIRATEKGHQFLDSLLGIFTEATGTSS